MTTDDLKYLFMAAYEFAEKKFGTKPNNIEIDEDGIIRAQWSHYIGCGDYEYTYETIQVEELNERIEYYKDHFSN